MMFVRTRFSYYAEDVKPYDPKSTFRGGRACEDLCFSSLVISSLSEIIDLTMRLSPVPFFW
jgi:hypothetical protein